MMQNLCKKYESLMELPRILYIAAVREPCVNFRLPSEIFAYAEEYLAEKLQVSCSRETAPLRRMAGKRDVYVQAERHKERYKRSEAGKGKPI